MKSGSLSTYIKDRFDTFSRSQKDVARYIVDHLDDVAFQTAEELARHVSTSSSTVVRFSQALGFEGYPELQQAARNEYRHCIASEGIGAEPAPFSLDRSEFEASLATDYVNVEETARKAPAADVAAAVEMIVRAERIVICGTDQLAFFASYLRHLLALLDLRSEVVGSATQDGLTRLARVSGNSLLIGLAAGRVHPLVARGVQVARNRGADTLAICDATLSDLSKLAEHSLYFSSNSPSYIRSHSALLALIQALAYAVYASDREIFKDRVRAISVK